MNDNKPLNAHDIAREELRALGITLSLPPGTYCVNFRDASAATAYFSDDLQDALEHGPEMAALAAKPAATPDKPPLKTRRKRRRPGTAAALGRPRLREMNRRPAAH